jgi:hypothetical protein
VVLAVTLVVVEVLAVETGAVENVTEVLVVVRSVVCSEWLVVEEDEICSVVTLSCSVVTCSAEEVD